MDDELSPEQVEDIRRGEAARQARYQAALRRVIPGPSRPLDVARRYLGCRDLPLNRWRGVWYEHAGTVQLTVTAEGVRASLVAWLANQTCFNKDKVEVPWPIGDRAVKDVVALLGDECHRNEREGETVGMFLNNVWLEPHRDGRMVQRGYTADVWNTAVADYPYDPTATCPYTRAKLAETFTPEALRLFVQWGGYVVSGRTDLHKMMVIWGQTRSGKGTILSLFRGLLGPSATASKVKLKSLAGDFGLQPLLGKRHCVLPEVRWNEHDASEATTILLAITGGDPVDVNRKNFPVMEVHLPVRFTACSNDPPTIADASGAMAGRMLIIQTIGTHDGREDPEHGEKMLAERPGVLNWFLEGLADLNAQGRFTEPGTSVEQRQEMRRDTTLAIDFVEDECIVAPDCWDTLQEVYDLLQKWCVSHGRRHMADNVFARQLYSAFPDLWRARDTAERRRTLLFGLTRTDHPRHIPTECLTDKASMTRFACRALTSNDRQTD